MYLFIDHVMIALDRLTTELRRRRIATGRELASSLGVSQATLSRLVPQPALPSVAWDGPGPRATLWSEGRPCRSGSSMKRGGFESSVSYTHSSAAHWLERDDGRGQLFAGLPPFAWDMSPQGYIGRNFSRRYPELDLPPRVSDWNDDQRRFALARRGEDCVGNLIIGDESFNRFLASVPPRVGRDEYPEYARRSLEEMAGSSAGGEQPKFAVYSEGRHVLVKVASGEAGHATQRWKDLLVCERIALELLRAAGVPAAVAHLFNIQGARFLEVERFDRVGERGTQRAVIPLRPRTRGPRLPD